MFKKTDQQKFNQVYDEYHSLVRNVLYNIVGKDALDDVTQETFIRIWNGLPRFAFRSSLKTWIYRITINTATDHFRKKKLMPTDLIDKEIERRESSHTLSTEALIIESSLDELDENSRNIIVLFYFEELTVKNISKILEIPEGTVKSRLHHAKDKMKKSLSNRGVNL